MNKTMLYKLTIVSVIFLFSSCSKSKNYSCKNLEKAKQNYIKDSSFVNGMTYGTCLFTKDEEDEGYKNLDQHSKVKMAYINAQNYTLPTPKAGEGDTLEKIGLNKVTPELAKNYYKALALIYSDSTYPDNEEGYQIQLISHYGVVTFQWLDLLFSVTNHHQQAWSQSPSYTGGIEDIDVTSDYINPLDILQNIIKTSSECASVSKKSYLNDFYNTVTNACSLYKEQAKNLLPMEKKRLELLASCPNITEKTESCPEYYKFILEIFESTVTKFSADGEKLDNFIETLNKKLRLEAEEEVEENAEAE